MSASRSTKLWAPIVLFGACTVVLAADNELPDMELLEYLGSWEESDEEWVMFDLGEEALATDADTRIDPASEDRTSDDDRSTEIDDET